MELEQIMKSFQIGTYQTQASGYKAFIPKSFPPEGIAPIPPELLPKLEKATWLVGKLNGTTSQLPDVDFFLLMFLRKDAASSSQIEGTRATMIDAIEAEGNVTDSFPEDVDDIQHYISALNHGMTRMVDDNFPLSLRLIREMHSTLMEKARGTQFSDPGQFRVTQNWIGGETLRSAHFVPPPPAQMKQSLAELEEFFHADDNLPLLIKAAMIHAQFETIHPFLDGNGRTGRMLVTLFLWKSRFLERPVLFLSSYFKKYQNLYYEMLNGYHEGRVYEWLDFFLEGVIQIAQSSIEVTGGITRLRDRDFARVQSQGKRSAETMIKILPRLYSQPIVNVKNIQNWTGYTRDGSYKVVQRLVDLGILTPRSQDSPYDQSYAYNDYIDLFSPGE